MKISAMTNSLPVTLPEAFVQLVELGFAWVDVPPAAAEDTVRRQLAECGLRVACVGLNQGQPESVDLASPDRSVRSASLEYFRQAINATVELGASVGYMVPPIDCDEATRLLWSESLVELAEYAQSQSVRVCIEHFPGRLLPTVASSLEFLRELNHDGLALLIDVGHCLISQEDPAQMVLLAGDRLGYVHFDDNDGRQDLHWPLLTGQLTGAMIRETFHALRAIQYDGAVCLELSAKLENPLENIRHGELILESYVSLGSIDESETGA
jgi:sugar phosphate isomerase/epimerase